MPVYEYTCRQCGDFSALRPIAQRHDPLVCQACGQQALRVIVTPPALSAMSGSRRLAHATNERSAHEPKSSARHGMSCQCCKPGKASGRTLQAADTSKSFPSARPWMISH